MPERSDDAGSVRGLKPVAVSVMISAGMTDKVNPPRLSVSVAAEPELLVTVTEDNGRPSGAVTFPDILRDCAHVGSADMNSITPNINPMRCCRDIWL